MCYQIFKRSHSVAITPQTTVIKTFKQKTSLKPEELGKKTVCFKAYLLHPKQS